MVIIESMQVGLIGFGKMGSRIMDKLLADEHEVVVWNRTKEVLDELRMQRGDAIVKQKLLISRSLPEFIDTLREPALIWMMLPAGEATESILQELIPYFKPGTIIIDGGNAYYKDTQKRYETFREKEIRYVGIGVSGGLYGEEYGYSLMVGGDSDTYEFIKPILDSLSKPKGGYGYFGIGGAGHFVKMIHNGIEYAMMQALAEGFGILAKAPYSFDLLEIAKTWQKGTIIQSFILDRAVDALSKDPQLSQIKGYIEMTGEGEWTVEQAREEKVDAHVIEKAVDYRKRSQVDEMVQNSVIAKLIAALRHEFGGHEIKKNS